MITFDKGNKRFLLRSVGIILNDDHVLLHRAEDDDFWSLPGGRVELLERAESSIKREMQEELDVDVKVKRLVWIVENFFEFHKKPHHELGLYFLLQLPEDFHFLNVKEEFRGQEQGLPLIFRWFPVEEIDTLELYPSFLRTSLKSLPTEISYISHIGNGDVVVA